MIYDPFNTFRSMRRSMLLPCCKYDRAWKTEHAFEVRNVMYMQKESYFAFNRSLLHVTLRNKVTMSGMSVSDEYRFTIIIPIADCNMHFSAIRFVFSQFDVTTIPPHEQLPLSAITRDSAIIDQR